MSTSSPSRGLGRRLLVLSSAACVLVVTLVAMPTAQSTPSWLTRRDADVTASANTGPAAQRAVDTVFRITRVAFRRVKADATAQASAQCDGCTADARTVHVVYLDRGSGGAVNNVATAWSRCADCRASALSVQVVVVRPGSGIEAHNRALAVNAGCDGCVATAAAFQLVVIGDDVPRLTRADRRGLRRWAVQQSAALRRGAVPDGARARSAGPGRAAAQGMGKLSRLVNGALGTTTLRTNVQLRSPQ
jgi:hypothetical protein